MVKAITLDPLPEPSGLRQWVQGLYSIVCAASKRNKRSLWLQLPDKPGIDMQELDIKFPIELIKDDLYLIGCERLNIKQNSNTESLLVRVGGGYVKFEDHVLKQNKYYQRMLVIYMIKSGESLEWVVEQLIANRKITG